MTLPPAHVEPATGPVEEPAIVHRIELAISYILRLGVLLSIGLVLFGAFLTFTHHSSFSQAHAPLKTILDPVNKFPFPYTVHDTIVSLEEFRGQGFIVLGLLVLLVTPVIRVAVSIFAFGLQRDWMFVFITTMVLLILLLSFFLGKAGAG